MYLVLFFIISIFLLFYNSIELFSISTQKQHWFYERLRNLISSNPYVPHYQERTPIFKTSANCATDKYYKCIEIFNHDDCYNLSMKHCSYPGPI